MKRNKDGTKNKYSNRTVTIYSIIDLLGQH